MKSNFRELSGILKPAERKPSKAYLVDELRWAVYKWCEGGYCGVTDDGILTSFLGRVLFDRRFLGRLSL